EPALRPERAERPERERAALGAGGAERFAAAALAGHGLAAVETGEAGKPQSDAYASRLPETPVGRTAGRPVLPGQRERPVG
ncbi:transcriptional regulator, partial [Streptomyces lydicus]